MARRCAGVDWDPSLRLPGWRRGETISTRSGPRRASILDAEGRPLDATGLGASIAGRAGAQPIGLQRIYDERLAGRRARPLLFGRRVVARAPAVAGRALHTTIEPGLMAQAARALAGLLTATGRPRLLEAEQLLSYLVARELVQREVADTFQVVEVSCRHAVYLIATDSGPGLVLKQARAGAQSSIAHEVATLRTLRRRQPGSALAANLPVVLFHDARRGLVVFQLSEGAEDLAQYHARGRFSITLAGALGRALGRLHRISADAIGDAPDVEPEWCLSLHRPRLGAIAELSRASMELIRVVQGCEELCARMDQVRASWHVTSVIHGDLRWDNCVAVARPGASRKTRILLIDWEAAGGGDAAFDLAAVFAEFLDAWAGSIPDTHGPAHAERARLPLRRMRPALAALWLAYLRERAPVNDAQGRRLLRRAMGFTAARLLQAALERAQRAPDLSTDMVVEVQLSLNVLRRPEAAAQRLLGLS